MKKKRNNFLKLFYFVLVIYSVYYAFYMFGYAEVKVHNETVLTEEAMRKFEKDISENKDVTLEDYLTINKKDYSNKICRFGNNIAYIFEYVMDEGLKNMVLIIRKLFS